MNPQKYVTVTEAAKIKECTRSTIYKFIHDGEINICEIGGRGLVVVDEQFQRLELRQDLRRKVNALESRLANIESKIEMLQQEVRK
jgi:excisionase family DNA binding protein